MRLTLWMVLGVVSCVAGVAAAADQKTLAGSRAAESAARAGRISSGLTGPTCESPSPPPRRAAVERLKAAVTGRDDAAVLPAARELKALGEPARGALRLALRQRLARDRAAVRRAAASAGGPEKFKALLGKVEARRTAALDNVAKLNKEGDSVALAGAHSDELIALQRKLNDAIAVREPVVAAMARRAELLAMYRETAPAPAAANDDFTDAAEAKLTATAERALGVPLASAAAAAADAAPFDGGPGPSDPVARHYWFYRACRRVEAYNRSLKGLLDAQERENLNLVNGYRECLGLMPYELDARLTQSARRHSKEMAELNYCAHESPTPGNKTHADRIRNAGYPQPTSENIARGFRGGKEAFQCWFQSPGHHQAMVHRTATAIGIGRWDRHWTQNTGSGPRLMLLPEEQRGRAGAVQGDVLKPQQ